MNGLALLIHWLGDGTQLGATGGNDSADEKVWQGGLRDGGGENGKSHSSRRAAEQTVTAIKAT